MQLYYDKHANIDLLKEKKIAIIGYGSQGHAHALNLKDSGMNVLVGLNEGNEFWDQAESDGLKVLENDKAAAWADIIMILVPDTIQPSLFETDILPHLKAGNVLAFAHGFNIHYNQVIPPPHVDVIMIAPKSPGHLLRRQLLLLQPGHFLFLLCNQHVAGGLGQGHLAATVGIGLTFRQGGVVVGDLGFGFVFALDGVGLQSGDPHALFHLGFFLDE